MKVRIQEALEILAAAGIDLDSRTARRRERLALALLALSNVRPTSAWSDAAVWELSDHALTSREAIEFWNSHYGENISSGSYDDVRRIEFVCLREAAIAISSAGDPGANLNSPTRRWAIAPAAGDLLREYGRSDWPVAVCAFIAKHGTLQDRVNRGRARSASQVDITLSDGSLVLLDSGPHNAIQKSVVEQFLPRFAPDAKILYIGDARKKIVHLDKHRLSELGFFEMAKGRLPDIVAVDDQRRWILLIEAVHSSNPMEHLRHLELERLTQGCTYPRVYVSAFATMGVLRRWLKDVAWETEVWVAEHPDHLIHFDGVRFLGPYEE